MHWFVFRLTLVISIAMANIKVQAQSIKTTLTCSGQKLEYLGPPRSSVLPGQTYQVKILVNGYNLSRTFVGGNGELVESDDKTAYFYGFGKNPYLSIKGTKYACEGDFYN